MIVVFAKVSASGHFRKVNRTIRKPVTD